MKKEIKIISWNVNGLRAILKKGFLEWIQKENPDILCLQETKISAKDIFKELEKIKGYHHFFSCADKSGYSGVAIFSKIEPNQVIDGFGIKKYDKEGRMVIVRYSNFTLANVYFPNGKLSNQRLKYKMDFYSDFRKYINTLKLQGEKVIFCGDVNTAHKEIDLARPKENSEISGFLPKERKWIDDIINDGYLDSFRIFNKNSGQYTWWSQRTAARKRNVGWRIDYFFVDKRMKNKIEDSYILNDVMGSDHCPIAIKIKI
ncbi:MAG TPA: exodeoxyribonuclease III [Candidatus Pacearchaeota archaeon]|nr:exodeoxyribonuclease III [Candidatus Parcubacteria bacterium]HOU45968.1 exodeoxyribonuclease III [Candidatus Pacearchaeota archaeon]HQI74633.1 exodeoxyribonuclease III [Candidatus Pacearchaeota archaeon]